MLLSHNNMVASQGYGKWRCLMFSPFPTINSLTLDRRLLWYVSAKGASLSRNNIAILMISISFL